MSALDLDNPVFGKGSIAGCWKSGPNEKHETSFWPEKYWSKDLAGAWYLFGKPVPLRLLESAKKDETYVQIDPFITQIRIRLSGEFSHGPFALDGTETPYLPVFLGAGSATWRCTSRSFTAFSGFATVKNIGTFQFSMKLEEGGSKVKLEATYVEKGLSFSRHFVRADSFPPATIPKSLTSGNPFQQKQLQSNRTTSLTSLASVDEDAPVIVRSSKWSCFPCIQASA